MSAVGLPADEGRFELILRAVLIAAMAGDVSCFTSDGSIVVACSTIEKTG